MPDSVLMLMVVTYIYACVLALTPPAPRSARPVAQEVTPDVTGRAA